MFYKVVHIDHCTYVPSPVSQYSAEIEYNEAFTSVMAVSHFRILNNDLINKDADVVPEQATLNILDIKSDLLWPRMFKTPNTPYTFPEEFTL